MIKLPSAYQPQDYVSVHLYKPFNGVVEAVRFTDREVFYDVISNGILHRNIKSEFIKDPIAHDPPDK